METNTVRLINAVLDSAVFQTIDIRTLSKDKQPLAWFTCMISGQLTRIHATCPLKQIRSLGVATARKQPHCVL